MSNDELTKAERDEIRAMIHTNTEGALARIEAAVNVIDMKVTHIEEHLRVSNGRLKKAEDSIIEMNKSFPHTVINCPQNETLRKMKSFVERARDSNEEKKLLKHDKRADAMRLYTLVGVTVSALMLLATLVFNIIKLS